MQCVFSASQREPAYPKAEGQSDESGVTMMPLSAGRLPAHMSHGALRENLVERSEPVPSLGPTSHAPIDVLLICAQKDEYDEVCKVCYGILASDWFEHALDNSTSTVSAFAESLGFPRLVSANALSSTSLFILKSLPLFSGHRTPLARNGAHNRHSGRRGYQDL